MLLPLVKFFDDSYPTETLLHESILYLDVPTPIDTLLNPLLSFKAHEPMPMLHDPSVLLLSESSPIAIFSIPAVKFTNDPTPIAIFPLVVLHPVTEDIIVLPHVFIAILSSV